MNDNIAMGQIDMTSEPSMQRRRAFAATFACLAGVALGLYAGIVAKGSDPARQTEWQAPGHEIASREAGDTIPR